MLVGERDVQLRYFSLAISICFYRKRIRIKVLLFTQTASKVTDTEDNR